MLIEMKIVETLVISIIFLISENIAIGQEPKKLFVFDTVTKYPVSFATIKVLSKTSGAFTNEKGEFSLKYSESDSLLISCIGYQSKTFFHTRDTFLLDPKNYTLPEVSITPIKNKKLEIGFFDSKDRVWNATRFSAEEVLKVDIPSEYPLYQIKAVKLKCRNPSKEPLVKLHIYDQNESGLPGNELLKSNVIVNDQLKIIHTIDLSNQNLFLSKRVVFVGIEWLISNTEVSSSRTEGFIPWNKFYVGYTYEYPQSTTFVRTVQFKEYKWVNNSILLIASMKYLNPGNLMISLIIE